MAVPCSDSGARKNEIMFDETGCGGDGGHTFCCPAGSSKMPTCGWYGHNNGRCPTRSKCPSDMTEIASNEIDCKKKGSKKQNFQTACCKTDVVGTKVYGVSIRSAMLRKVVPTLSATRSGLFVGVVGLGIWWWQLRRREERTRSQCPQCTVPQVLLQRQRQGPSLHRLQEV